jgi:hypothetical protein
MKGFIEVKEKEKGNHLLPISMIRDVKTWNGTYTAIDVVGFLKYLIVEQTYEEVKRKIEEAL